MAAHRPTTRHPRHPLARWAVGASIGAGLLAAAAGAAGAAPLVVPITPQVGGSFEFSCGTGADEGWAIIEFSLFNHSESPATLGVWNNNAGSGDSSFYVPRDVPAKGTVTYRHRIASGSTGNFPGIEVQPSGNDIVTGSNVTAPVCVQVDETSSTSTSTTTTTTTTVAETTTTTGPTTTADVTTSSVATTTTAPLDPTTTSAAPTTTVAVASGGPTTTARAASAATLPSTGVEHTALLVTGAVFVGLGLAVRAGARRGARSSG